MNNVRTKRKPYQKASVEFITTDIKEMGDVILSSSGFDGEMDTFDDNSGDSYSGQ